MSEDPERARSGLRTVAQVGGRLEAGPSERAPLDAPEARRRPASPSAGQVPPSGRGPAAAFRLGVAGIVLAFLVLGGLHLVSVTPFLPADETSHTGYAVLVGRWQLPTLDSATPLLPRMPTRFASRRQVYTANHPPLFYALAAIPLKAGIATGHPTTGVYGARALSLLLSGFGIVAVALLTRLLVPERPALAISAAGLVAAIPSLHQTSALVHNDGLAFALATATLAASALVLIRGPSRGRLLLLALLAAAAALTRATNLSVVGVAGLAAGLAALPHLRRPLAARLGAGVIGASLVGLAVLVMSGWFYLRNLRLYGDFTGVEPGREIFDQHPRGPLLEFLTADRVLRVHDQLWGRLAGSQDLARDAAAIPYRVLTGLIILGGVVLIARAAYRRRRPEARRVERSVAAASGAGAPGHGQEAADVNGRPAQLGRAVAWAFALLVPVLLYISLIGFFADGGGLHARYLYPGLGGLAAAGAVALAALPGGRRGVPAIAMLAAHLGLAVAFWGIWVQRVFRRQGSFMAQIDKALEPTGLPPALVLVSAAVLLLAAFTLSAWSIWRLSAAGPATQEPPEPPPARRATPWAPRDERPSQAPIG